MVYICKSKDTRIKSYFEIVNTSVEPNVILPVIAMSDGGSMGQLTLPARKIHQLGLKPMSGKEGKMNISGVVPGASSVKLVFSPHVVVKFYFKRSAESEVEHRAVATFATCHERDYLNYMATKDEAPTQIAADQELPVTPAPPGEGSSATAPSEPTTPPASAIGMVPLHLSPAYHRPIDKPEQQVALGQELLGKLAVHADFANSVLWVEEEVPIDEE